MQEKSETDEIANVLGHSSKLKTMLRSARPRRITTMSKLFRNRHRNPVASSHQLQRRHLRNSNLAVSARLMLLQV